MQICVSKGRDDLARLIKVLPEEIRSGGRGAGGFLTSTREIVDYEDGRQKLYEALLSNQLGDRRETVKPCIKVYSA